ncbi:MAG: CBS domain-containing protein [Cyanothece sp. SIO1E1]|nr:CBS domain-containing protein [Cyanothece sp. SIO1E1]
MENAIPQRVFDSMRQYPPFSLMISTDLMHIAEKISIRFVAKDQWVFRAKDPVQKQIYFVQEGAIHMLKEDQGAAQLVEACDQGEIFGLGPLLEISHYRLSAKAEEDSLIYIIPQEILLPIIEKQSKVSWYFAQSFAAGKYATPDLQGPPTLFWQEQQRQQQAFELVEIQSIDHSREPVCCAPGISIQAAAQIMRDKSVGSIIIADEDQHAVGIITDRDLRNKVVSGSYPLSASVDLIMSKPVITVKPEVTIAEVQILMMKHRIHHLVLTQTGKPNSPVVGVISEHDLLVIQGNNPAVLIREISRSQDGEELKRIREKAEGLLKRYLYQEVAIGFISSIMTQINDAIIEQAIRLALQEMLAEGKESPGVNWCWLALGSEGREEQLLRTDQDNALVFEDVSAEHMEEVKAYFLLLAKKVTGLLNQCGFEYCPGDMMASNPQWCLPLNAWKKQFSGWIFAPSQQHVLYSNIFFDFRPIYGTFELAEELSDHIFQATGERDIFLSFMAKNALQTPAPLTFFRQFMVERSGEHKDQFDIKSRAMMPLADAARVLILAAQVPQINNTFRRFDKLAELEPQNRALFEQAADAYEILVRYRALQGLKNRNSGRFFKPSELSKMERLNLRNSFKPLRELQDLLTVRFRLNFLI